MLSQRIIPLLLDHQDIIRYQGPTVRAFRNMMAQKVQMPVLFSGDPWPSIAITNIHRT
jgi:hypothetical protein